MGGEAEEVEEKGRFLVVEGVVHGVEEHQEKKDAEIDKQVRLVLIKHHSRSAQQHLEEELNDHQV